MDFFPLKFLKAKEEYTGQHANVEIQLGDYTESLKLNQQFLGFFFQYIAGVKGKIVGYNMLNIQEIIGSIPLSCFMWKAYRKQTILHLAHHKMKLGNLIASSLKVARSRCVPMSFQDINHYGACLLVLPFCNPSKHSTKN